MGAQPKRKLHRKYQRRASKNAEMPSFTKCPDTNKWMLSHTVSPHTGKYKGKQIVMPKDAE